MVVCSGTTCSIISCLSGVGLGLHSAPRLSVFKFTYFYRGYFVVTI